MLTLEDCIEKGRVDGLKAADHGWCAIYFPGVLDCLGKTAAERALLLVAHDGPALRDETARDARMSQWADDESEAVTAAGRALAENGATPDQIQAYIRSRAVAIEEYRLASERAIDALVDASRQNLSRAERRRLESEDRRMAKRFAQAGG